MGDVNGVTVTTNRLFVKRSVGRLPAVILGAAQTTTRDLLDRSALARIAAAAALDDARVHPAEVGRVVVLGTARGPDAGAGELARALGCTTSHVETTERGGDLPLWVLTDAATRSPHDAPLTLIVTAEAAHTARHREVAAGAAAPTRVPVIGPPPLPLSAVEWRAGIEAPVHAYALVESVLAAEAGRGPAAHRRQLGQTLAPFSACAAQHPQAWFRQARSADEIATPGAANRLVTQHYTKSMLAFPSVNQAAAVVVGPERAGGGGAGVHVLAAALAEDPASLAARRTLHASRRLESIAARLGDLTGDALDLDGYVSAPCMIEIVRRAFPDSPEPRTLTGGMPYFGNPANGYALHAVATAVERVRRSGTPVAVHAVGWFLARHRVVVLGAEPIRRARAALPQLIHQAPPEPEVVVRPAVDGEQGTLEAIAVLHDRTGAVAAAPAFVRTRNGARVVAAAGHDALGEAASTEPGGTVTLSAPPSGEAPSRWAPAPG